MNLTTQDVLILASLFAGVGLFIYKVMYSDPEDSLPDYLRDDKDER
jgi:hypothetical protein